MTALADKTETLRAVELFHELKASQLSKIARVTDEIEVRQDREIVRERTMRESGGASFFLILEGRADVVQRGRRVARLNPGDYFGEMSLLDGQPRSATVIATTPMRLYRIRSWHFQRLVKSEPAIAVALLKHLAERVRALTETQTRSR
jgi:CRP/FNR family transcriptional regulator, cyclic AMP receptor protein